MWEWKVKYERKGTGGVYLSGRTAHPWHAISTVEATVAIIIEDVKKRIAELDGAKNLMDSLDGMPAWGE